MTDVSTAMSTTPSWPAEPESGDNQAPGAPNSSRTLETSATVLERLEADGWRTLHDRLSPGSFMVIDHVAVGPGGIFVIDSHSFARSSAEVTVISDPDQPAKISAAQAVADTVRSLLPPLTRQYVVSVIAYADTSPMHLSRGPIQICTTAMLGGLIAARHNVLGASEIADIVTSLDAALQPAGDGPRPAARLSTPPPVQAEAAAVADSDSASNKSGESRKGRRFLGRRGSKAGAADAAAPDVAPVVEYPGSTSPPSPYPFVSPPVAAIRGTSEPATDPELDIEPQTQLVAETDSPVIQADAFEHEVEVVEPEIGQLTTTDVDSSSYDDVPLIDYFRDLRATDREAAELADLGAEVSSPEHEATTPGSPKHHAYEAYLDEPEVERDSLGYHKDLGYDHLFEQPNLSTDVAGVVDGGADRDDAADVEASAEVEGDMDTAPTATPDEPAWEALSIEDLHTEAADREVADLDIMSPAASSPVHAAPLEVESPLTAPTRQPGGRRRAPAKPWHHLASANVPSAPPRRARQLTAIEESEELPEVVVEQEPAAIVEPTTHKAFSFVDPTEAGAASAELSAATIDGAPLPSFDTEIESEADRHEGLHLATSSPDVAPAEQLEPEADRWSVDQTDAPWTPAPAIAPRVETQTFATPSAANAWDTGLTVAVSRWKAARVGQSSTSTAPPPPDVEPGAAGESVDASPSRKQSVAAAPTASMPAGLSRRGQKMYAAMNGDGALSATPETDEPVPRRRTIRKLFVFALVAGLLLLSSMHYAEISSWVSDHVDLPGIGESQDDPHKGGKDSDKGKSSRPEAENDNAKASSTDNR